MTKQIASAPVTHELTGHMIRRDAKNILTFFLSGTKYKLDTVDAVIRGERRNKDIEEAIRLYNAQMEWSEEELKKRALEFQARYQARIAAMGQDSSEFDDIIHPEAEAYAHYAHCN